MSFVPIAFFSICKDTLFFLYGKIKILVIDFLLKPLGEVKETQDSIIFQFRTPAANPQKRDKKHQNPPLKGHKTPSVPPLVHQALSIAQKVDRLTNRQVMPAGRVKKKGLKK